MKRLLIIGAGGHGRVSADVALKMNCFSDIVFLDDNPLASVPGYKLLGSVGRAEEFLDGSAFFVAVGNNAIRKKLLEDLLEKGAEIATLIHPSACVGSNVRIGPGTVVMAGTVVNNGAVLGTGVIVNTCASVDHDCVIGAYSHVSVGAHLAGAVTLGAAAMVGAGATIINNLTVCDGCTVGAGAVVVRDIEKRGVYAGVPARWLRKG